VKVCSLLHEQTIEHAQTWQLHTQIWREQSSTNLETFLEFGQHFPEAAIRPIQITAALIAGAQAKRNDSSGSRLRLEAGCCRPYRRIAE
jgi:hypothetical protein